ncbi:MAG: NERD domain-containing protein [Actinomycetales bacterium]|nr:NERD domain-containing protein [Actinomycetales bacterium]
MSETPVAGASAAREYERRRARDEQRIRAEWGRFGELAVRLTPERRSTQAWATGAEGERKLGARLDAIASDTIRVLHDRRIPGTRANIDHLVVTRAGIWVVDAKKYKGRPERRLQGGLLSGYSERLFVGGRDQTKLVEGVASQVQRVQGLMGEIPVSGVLCFVDAEWPLIGGEFSIRETRVTWPRRLAKRIRRADEYSHVADPVRLEMLLAVAFPGY